MKLSVSLVAATFIMGGLAMGLAQDNAPATAAPAAAAPAPAAAAKPVVVIATSLGDITAELWPDKAPETVKNFLAYVDEKFYDGTIFHRVIDGFMIQGGGFTADMAQKKTKGNVKNEAKTDVVNARGTLAMARTAVVDSATAQFFINHKDNDFLNHKEETTRGFGYCVFGKVTAGMDVVDKIAKVKTGNSGMLQNVPETAVVIKSVRRAEAAAKPQG
jgi:cyclophilin family peptidyl-prolyl cis-trans isomerase